LGGETRSFQTSKFSLERGIIIEQETNQNKVLRDVVVAHAALYGGMMSNFGRTMSLRVIEEGAKLHFFASREKIFGFTPPIEELEEIGGEYHGLNIPEKLSPIRYLLAILSLTNQLREERVDILHTRGAVIGLIGRVAGRVAGVPVVVHHQDDLHFRDQKHGPMKRKLISRIERALSQLSDRSLFVSEAVFRDALKVGFDPSRCVNVGHDLTAVFQTEIEKAGSTEKRHPLLESCGVPKNKIVIGCVGRLSQLKGFDIVIQVAEAVCARNPNCVFFIKGDGPLREELMNDVARRGLKDKIFFGVEKIPQRELPSLFKSFDIFFLPTRREGFGMVFAESMSMGVPVVGPKIEPVTEVVKESCGILVSPDDTDQYAGALLKLVDTPEYRKGLGRRGREYALSTWSGNRSADAVIAVYQDLLNKSCAGSTEHRVVAGLMRFAKAAFSLIRT
jgi:glycosyltransferase involved in cell wall biosynthesis